MAQIALDLSQFRSAGVYTIEIDNSEQISVTTQSLRLVPGFAAQGPYNTPVFITSTTDLQRFFGPIDLRLEKKGSFFQRSIQTCLLTAPVFAINLLQVNSQPNSATADTVEFIGLSLDCSTQEDPSAYLGKYNDLYVNFFNRQRFWNPDPNYLEGVVTNKYGASTVLQAPLFQFVNLGTTPVSFLVRKAQDLNQYKVYAKDWYGSAANIPYEWIRPYDYISDYFVQIIAVGGDWTNSTKLSTDPYYSQFFNKNGLIPSELQSFLNSNNVTVIGSWTGTIIPDFKDQTGSEQYIEAIVNGSTPLTGILLNVNDQELDQLNWSGTQWVLGDASTGTNVKQVDLVGHNLANQVGANIKFLSYTIDVSDANLHSSVNLTSYPVGDTTGMSFYLNASSGAANITVGSLIAKANGTGIIPGVTYVTEKYYDGSAYIVQTAEPIITPGTTTSNHAFNIQNTLDDPSVCSSYSFIYLGGLNLMNRHLPGFDSNGAMNAEAGVSKIYGMLQDSGISRGLLNKDMIQYRYIVDTMAYGLQSEMGGKAYLSILAKARGKTTALLNAPAIAQFASSVNPYFCDTFVPGVDPTPVFDSTYIPQGGNPDMPRSFRFSLPTEDDGAKYCGVFGPFLTYNDGGKLISVPPAADVANAYVRKFLGGDPFAIVANRNGILSNPNLAGVEYMIDKVDRDNLEPFGYNSIIERPTTGQVMIYANATAFQLVKSDFNNLHVRELLNTLELQIEEVLDGYVFDFNNPVTRLNIINSITPILESTKDAGALTNYTIQMDDNNNTSTIIQAGVGIVDIGVWVTGALKVIVNRMTVNSVGGVASGGFAY